MNDESSAIKNIFKRPVKATFFVCFVFLHVTSGYEKYTKNTHTTWESKEKKMSVKI